MQIVKKPTRLVASRPTKLSKEVKTDQSYKKSCDINNIVTQFMKTGVLPSSSKMPQYGDFTEVPTLEASFDVVQTAREAFYSLPSDIRKLLDNDPSKLESFVLDVNNKEICLKHGLLTEKVKETTKVTDTTSHVNNNTNQGDSNATTGDQAN